MLAANNRRTAEPVEHVLRGNCWEPDETPPKLQHQQKVLTLPSASDLGMSREVEDGSSGLAINAQCDHLEQVNAHHRQTLRNNWMVSELCIDHQFRRTPNEMLGTLQAQWALQDPSGKKTAPAEILQQGAGVGDDSG